MNIEKHTIVKLYNIVTSKRRFIVCPGCEKKGIITVLGELTEDGGIEVMRFHNGKTKIIGKEFKVICGLCNESVYCKVENE